MRAGKVQGVPPHAGLGGGKFSVFFFFLQPLGEAQDMYAYGLPSKSHPNLYPDVLIAHVCIGSTTKPEQYLEASESLYEGSVGPVLVRCGAL